MLSGLRVVSRDQATSNSQQKDSTQSKKHTKKRDKGTESHKKHKRGKSSRRKRSADSGSSSDDISDQRISKSRKHAKSSRGRYSDPSSASDTDSGDSDCQQEIMFDRGGLDGGMERNKEKDRAIAAREAAGLEWMVKAPKPTIKNPEAEIAPVEVDNEETFKVNPKELNPYLKDGAGGYPSDSFGTENRGKSLPQRSVVGDGGLSWRLKALRRAKEQAEREGHSLEKVVEERYGSLSEILVSVSAKRAAHSHAHLHAIRDRRRNTDKVEEGNEGGENKASTTSKDKDMDRIGTSNWDYLKDVSSRDKRMKVPRVTESLSWRSGKGGRSSTMRREDEKLFRKPAGALNKFKNDGNFLETFYGKEAVQGDSKTDKNESELQEQTGHQSNDRQKVEATLVSDQSTAGMTANQIAAKALQLRLSGKINEANELLSHLQNKKQEEERQEKSSETRTQHDAANSQYSLKSVVGDYNSRFRKDETGDAGLVKSILQNKQYNLSTCADNEYEHGGAVFEDSKSKKMKNTASKHSREKDSNKAIQAHKRIITQEERCKFCFNNPSRSKHLTISIATTCYLMLPPWEPLVEGHCLLVPMQHGGSSRNVDDNVWEELRNYKKCLLQMFANQDKDVVFMETAMNLAQQRRHCLVECIPLPRKLAKQAPLYFKKAIDEAEDEWSQHDAKKLINTSGKGLRASIPKNFPYFNIEFGLNAGYVHVIDNEKDFKPEFGRNVIIGILKLPEEEMHRRRRQQSHDEERKAAFEFRKVWDEYDWTKMLD